MSRPKETNKRNNIHLMIYSKRYHMFKRCYAPGLRRRVDIYYERPNWPVLRLKTPERDRIRQTGRHIASGKEWRRCETKLTLWCVTTAHSTLLHKMGYFVHCWQHFSSFYLFKSSNFVIEHSKYLLNILILIITSHHFHFSFYTLWQNCFYITLNLHIHKNYPLIQVWY